jgi:hypothetical protein
MQDDGSISLSPIGTPYMNTVFACAYQPESASHSAVFSLIINQHQPETIKRTGRKI